MEQTTRESPNAFFPNSFHLYIINNERVLTIHPQYTKVRHSTLVTVLKLSKESYAFPNTHTWLTTLSLVTRHSKTSTTISGLTYYLVTSLICFPCYSRIPTYLIDLVTSLPYFPFLIFTTFPSPSFLLNKLNSSLHLHITHLYLITKL